MKNFIQRIASIIAQICVLPLALLYKISGSESLFVASGQFLSLIPGKIGSYFRCAYYDATLEGGMQKGYIGFGSYFAHPEVELESGVYIGGYCIIGMAKIGANATIASSVSVLSGKKQHGYREIGVPIQQQPGVFTKIIIGPNCWIGSGAIIMANLGVQNVVAAGSVVINDTEDFCVLSGNPAHVVKQFNK